MMNKFLKLVILILLCTELKAIPPINIFRPSDRLLIPLIPLGSSFQLTIGYEGSFSTKAFQDDFNDCNNIPGTGSPCIGSNERSNVLQIYQDKQNFLAGLKGFESTCPIGQLSQLFNINDENGLQGLFVPSGCFKVPLNLLISARYYFKYNLSLALHMQVLSMELSDVKWRRIGLNEDDNIDSNIINFVQDISGLNIGGWKKTGFGDIVLQGLWIQDFPQRKRLISNVQPQFRLGINIPTGLKQDENRVLAFPLGNDGSWGIQVGGGLSLDSWYGFRAGFDAEFLFLFGNTRARRIKTECNQTDLLFLTKLPAFKEFGLGQQFNVFFEKYIYGLGLGIDYQYLKRDDDKLTVFNDGIDNFLSNTAQNLQDWTAHSIITSVRTFLPYYFPKLGACPTIFGWLKFGFNGKRAILLNTIGINITLSF